MGQRLTKAQRAQVREKFGGRCAYCGALLGERWHADHTEAVYRAPDYEGGMRWPERNVFEKLFPACPPCNLFKATFNIEQFRREISMQVERARNTSVNFRTAERFGQLKVEDAPIVFHFERIAQGTAQ